MTIGIPARPKPEFKSKNSICHHGKYFIRDLHQNFFRSRQVDSNLNFLPNWKMDTGNKKRPPGRSTSPNFEHVESNW